MLMNPRDEAVYTNFPLGSYSPVTETGDKDLDTLYDQITNNFLKGINRYHIIVMGVGSIKCLEKNTLSMLVQQRANIVGIDIHLFDLPSLYSINDEFKKEYICFEDNDIDLVYSQEFDSISLFAKNNNLTKVSVYCNAYNIKNFEYKYPNLKLECTPIGWQYPAFWTFKFTNLEETVINKTFWCGNWKYAPHRHLVSSYLARDLNNVNLSWYYNTSLESNIWFNLDSSPYKETLLEGQTKLTSSVPVVMDYNISKILPFDNSETVNIDHRKVPTKFYNETFCTIINETRFAQPFAALTEKTMQAIIHAKPFIMVGPPNSLKFIQDMGWKTFDKWWDESYDSESNHEKRLYKIFEVIDYIKSKSKEELEIMYKDMYEVLIHNQQQLVSLSKLFRNVNIDNNEYFRKIRNVY